MDYEFTCTRHNFQFGFGKPPKGWEVALIKCPLCLDTDLQAERQRTVEVSGHRDVLLQAMEIKLTIPHGEKP